MRMMLDPPFDVLLVVVYFGFIIYSYTRWHDAIDASVARVALGEQEYVISSESVER